MAGMFTGRSRRALLVLAAAFLLSLPAVTTRIYASDEIQYFAWLRSWAFDRDVDFENEYRHFYETGVARNALFHETFLERVNENGRRINFGPIGSAVLWAPFYAVGHLRATASGAPADGFSQPYIAAITYGSAVYGFAAILLSAAVARRLVGRGLAASLAIAGGTPLIFYIYITPAMSHANSAFTVSLFVWVWLRARERWRVRDAIALGLAGALMAMVREQDAVLAAGPAIDFVLHGARGLRNGARGLETAGLKTRGSIVIAAIAGAAAFLVGFAPQLLAYEALNGHPGPTELTLRKMTWTSPHALGVMFSPNHGLFFWTPLALVAIVGLGLMAMSSAGRAGIRRASGAATSDHQTVRRIAALALLMIALQVYVSGAVESWTVSGAFGQRRFVAITPLLTVGLAGLLAAARSAPVVSGLRVLVALCIWWNLGLIVQFGAHRMDRTRLTPGANAYTTFVELPLEVPSLAWRYLTDRSSFYRQPRLR
jgi:hypothetical protein